MTNRFISTPKALDTHSGVGDLPEEHRGHLCGVMGVSVGGPRTPCSPAAPECPAPLHPPVMSRRDLYCKRRAAPRLAEVLKEGPQWKKRLVLGSALLEPWMSSARRGRPYLSSQNGSTSINLRANGMHHGITALVLRGRCPGLVKGPTPQPSRPVPGKQKTVHPFQAFKEDSGGPANCLQGRVTQTTPNRMGVIPQPSATANVTRTVSPETDRSSRLGNGANGSGSAADDRGRKRRNNLTSTMMRPAKASTKTIKASRTSKSSPYR